MHLIRISLREKISCNYFGFFYLSYEIIGTSLAGL